MRTPVGSVRGGQGFEFLHWAARRGGLADKAPPHEHQILQLRQGRVQRRGRLQALEAPQRAKTPASTWSVLTSRPRASAKRRARSGRTATVSTPGSRCASSHLLPKSMPTTTAGTQPGAEGWAAV